MGLHGRIKQDTHSGGELFIASPEDVSHWDFGEHLEGERFISIENLGATQAPTHGKKSIGISAVTLF